MQLPILKPGIKSTTALGEFKGIDGDYITDMVNLSCVGKCTTRKARKSELVLDEEPDQIIECTDCIYLRYGDTLKKVFINSGGEVILQNQIYSLEEQLIPFDRKIIEYDGKTYVLPDGLQIGNDSWVRFAMNDSIAAALPFKDGRTLVYPEDPNNTMFCSDALALKTGMQLKFFNFSSDEIFTVKTVEKKITVSESGEVTVTARRITLDKTVENYNAMPENVSTFYCDPENRPIFNELTVGCHHTVEFKDNRILITPNEQGYTLPFEDYFKIGQTVQINGASHGANQKTAKITDIKDNCIYFDKNFVSYTENPKIEIRIRATMPNFDHCLITENRLFGADNVGKKFHISELDNPFVFTDISENPSDSWSVNINSPLTGIALWKDSVICFTDDGGFRVLGYNATNFGMRQLSVNGVKRGFSDSLCRVGDTLYYYSSKGVMKYSGGSDSMLFAPSIPIKAIKKSISDGTSVFMLTDDRIWVYDTAVKACWSEDGENISHIFRVNGYCFYCSNGTIYSVDSDLDQPINWSFTLENIPPTKEFKIQPLYLKLYFLSGTDCTFTVYTREFGKTTPQNSGAYSVKGEGSVNIPLPKSVCDEIEITVKGVGKFSPESWVAGYRKI